MTATAPSDRSALWSIRIYYFAWIGAGAFIIPFIGLFFIRNGLTGVQIGVLGLISSAAMLVAHRCGAA